MPKIKNKIIGKLLYGMAIGAIVAIISSILAIWNPFNSWHLKLSNGLFTRNEAGDEIVIVGIDETSIKEKPKGLGSFTKWRRTYYADVISKIEAASAKTIGLDISLSEEASDIPQEVVDNTLNTLRDLSETEQKSKIYEQFIMYKNILDNPDDIEFKNIISSNLVLSGLLYNFTPGERINSFKIAETLLPINASDIQSQVGFTNIDLDEDGIVRKVPLIFQDENGSLYESFALNLAQKFTNNQIDTARIPLENGRMLINYFGQPGSYKYISFIDVYDDVFDPNDFKDKIVLIGITNPTIGQDNFLIPTNKNIPAPGVEVHANAIQTILEGKFLINQTIVSQIITIAAISIIAAVVLSFLNIWLGIVLALLLLLGYTGSAHIMYRNGVIINMVYPYIAIVLTYFGSIIYKYFTELKSKKYIQTAFSRYLSPNVLKEVLKNPGMLHRSGMKKEITVFFSDIAGFTTVSEKLDPKDLIDLVNDYLAVMTDIILKYEGTLDKYVGDAIVAYFGAPIDQPDHAKRACAVALEMRNALPKLHEKWKAEGKPLLDFRIGINTGVAIVGNVGSEQRFDYTIMGDEVNLGSRLEGVNKRYGTHILLSEDTYLQIQDDFIVREIDNIRVKGKNEPIRIFELLARKGGLSEVGQSLLAPYNHGVRLYLSRNFKEAYAEFKKALEIFPDDGPSKIYLQRCDILTDYPPPKDWDGVFTMKEK